MTDLLTIETRRQSNFEKKQRHSFDFDNFKKDCKIVQKPSLKREIKFDKQKTKKED